jgi:sulfite reductase alpha subunit-like flavoprotein
MGKSIDKRLEELGGVRLFPLRCADEATGLEEVVEQWKIDIMEVLHKAHAAPAAAAVDTTTSACTTQDNTPAVDAVPSSGEPVSPGDKSGTAGSEGI